MKMYGSHCFHLSFTGEEYVRKSMEQYEAEYRERQVRNLKRKAQELGYELKDKAEVANQD